MKKWKRVYELFKKSNFLDEMDLRFIKISEDMLATKKPICKNIVYSELWLSSWINTTRYRVFMQHCINNISQSNIQIH